MWYLYNNKNKIKKKFFLEAKTLFMYHSDSASLHPHGGGRQDMVIAFVAY